MKINKKRPGLAHFFKKNVIAYWTPNLNLDQANLSLLDTPHSDSSRELSNTSLESSSNKVKRPMKNAS